MTTATASKSVSSVVKAATSTPTKTTKTTPKTKSAPKLSIRNALQKSYASAVSDFETKVTAAFMPAAQKAVAKPTRHVEFHIADIDFDQSITAREILAKELRIQVGAISATEQGSGYQLSLMLPEKEKLVRKSRKAVEAVPLAEVVTPLLNDEDTISI